MYIDTLFLFMEQNNSVGVTKLTHCLFRIRTHSARATLLMGGAKNRVPPEQTHDICMWLISPEEGYKIRQIANSALG